MKRIALLATTALAAGYANGSGRVETVLVKGDNGPIRVNKSDFDADQAGDKKYTRDTKAENDAAAASGQVSDVNVTGEGGVQTTAAPSAPNFSDGDAGKALPIDETKNAVAPKTTTADQLLVMKQGTGKSAKFFISDGMGQKITGDRAKQLGIDEEGYDTEAAAKAVQSTTEPKPAA